MVSAQVSLDDGSFSTRKAAMVHSIPASSYCAWSGVPLMVAPAVVPLIFMPALNVLPSRAVIISLAFPSRSTCNVAWYGSLAALIISARPPAILDRKAVWSVTVKSYVLLPRVRLQILSFLGTPDNSTTASCQSIFGTSV